MTPPPTGRALSHPAPRVTPPVATVAEARTELGRFFAIAALADEAPGMFSAYIDAEWHRFAETEDYPAFCHLTAGTLVRHDATCGEGPVAWVDSYHQRFGDLPPIWFADDTGAVDADTYATYQRTRTVRASWNCTADTGDPDYAATTG